MGSSPTRGVIFGFGFFSPFFFLFKFGFEAYFNLLTEHFGVYEEAVDGTDLPLSNIVNSVLVACYSAGCDGLGMWNWHFEPVLCKTRWSQKGTCVLS